MKIYSATQSEHTLADFVGKDLWVLCESNTSGRQCYVMVYCTYGSKGYFGCVHSTRGLTEGILTDYTDIGNLFLCTYINNNKYTVVEPLQTIPMSDLVVTDKYSEDTLHKLEGKDLWVSTIISCSYSQYYVQVLSINNNIVTYRPIDEFLIMQGSAGRQTDIQWAIDLAADETTDYEKLPIQAFKVQKPLEVLSSEEILEILHNNYSDIRGLKWP
jgi:hypothetical protein